MTLRTLLRDDLDANLRKRGFLWGVYAFFFHPGFMVVAFHRAAAALYTRGMAGKVFSKIIWRLGVLLTGCQISPMADIGSGLYLPHALGIVIGDGAKIGANVTIYQNVTIGRLGMATLQYPVIGEGACLYTGCTIIGGVTIGSHATIAAHALVLKDVPGNATVIGAPARVLARP